MPDSPKVRLALVDDHPKLLAGLAGLLGTEANYEIVATGGSAADAIAIAEQARPSVMIVDLSMPGDVFAAIDSMTRLLPTLKIVVFTAFASVEMALRALDAGAQAFVLKGRPTNDLFDAIEAVGRGELYASPEFAPRLRDGFRNRARVAHSGPPMLSSRERQVIDGLLLAQTSAEIAASLALTDKTVRHYITALMRKLGARNRLELVHAIHTIGVSARTDLPIN